ncbi:peptidylprolyl isomerase [Enorma phocaeensis]|uniref:peptidylprolyl isomerase n=1 Tax=Enorma phocaeensis TaxID=1871019 RepID=UPI0032097C2D
MASNNQQGKGRSAGKHPSRNAHSGASAPLTKGDFKREQKRKMGTGVKYVLVVIGILAMLLSVTGVACSGILNQVQSGESYNLTGGVAATVNGVNITEDTVTNQIMSTRSSLGCDADEDWAAYLAQNDQTPESYRESVIQSIAEDYLLTEAIRDNNITVSDEEVEARWQEAVAGYESEDAFVSMLSQLGYTEDSYKQMIESQLQQQALRDAVAPVEDPTDDEIIAYANENLSTYNDARRSSHILIKVAEDADDATREEARQQAQDILDQINAGEISFEDAAKEYSDDSSAENGGDVGWDKETTFVDAYQEALSALDTGQVSGVVETEYGLHIITCTDHFYVDGEVTSIDQIPEDLRTTFSDAIKSEKQGTAYTEWFQNYVDSADLQINEMPADVPYNVDMSLATSASTDEGDASGDASSTGDAAAE